jgi:hypothetical protein
MRRFASGRIGRFLWRGLTAHTTLASNVLPHRPRLPGAMRQAIIRPPTARQDLHYLKARLRFREAL